MRREAKNREEGTVPSEEVFYLDVYRDDACHP